MKSSTDFDTPEELVEAFCQYLVRCRKSPQTVKGRRGDLLALIRWATETNQHPFDLNVFATAMFESYRTWLLTQFKGSTVNRRLTSLSLFLNWSVRQHLLDRRALPVIRTVRLQARDFPEFWFSPPSVSQLLGAVKKSGDLDEIAIVAILAGSGLRISDLFLLRWKDIDIGRSYGTITIAKKSYRQKIQLRVDDWRVLLAIMDLEKSKKHSKKDLVFQREHNPWTRRAVEMLIARYAKLAGLQPTTPTMLRHSFIMNLKGMGVPPNEILYRIGSTTLGALKPHFD